MAANGGNVLVAGAINTDLVARVNRAPAAGETVTGTAFNVFGGGKGANQALAAARSGASTIMLGALGADEFGRQRLADLELEGIDIGSVPLLDGVSSGVALIVVDESGQNRIAYVPGATKWITAEMAIAAFERAKPAIVLSTLELPADSLQDLFIAARGAGAKVICNATPESSSGRALLKFVDCLIVNEVEAEELLGVTPDFDWSRASSELQSLGPSWIVITLGEAGALANIDGSTLRVAAPQVTVIDSTGAGDAFCGAFVASLAAEEEPAEALKAGVAAGSLAVTVAGAQRSMPTRGEIERLSGEISIERL